MAEMHITFEWPVDEAGYEVRQAAGDRVLLSGSGEGEQPPRLSIVRKGGPERMASPLKFHAALYLDFAALDGSPDACADFACRFGYLTERADDATGELVSIWQDAIANLRSYVGRWQADPSRFLDQVGGELAAATLKAKVVRLEPDGRPALSIQPPSLRQAMQLQFAQAIVSGRRVRDCDQCGAWFETGPGARRADARFCSDRCRVAFSRRGTKGEA